MKTVCALFALLTFWATATPALAQSDSLFLQLNHAVQTCVAANDTAEAKESCAITVDIARNIYLSALQKLAAAYAQDKEYDQALAAVNAALRIDPQDLRLLSAKVGLLSQKEDYEDAIAAANALLQMTPNSAHVLNVRAWSLYKLGRNNEALPDVQKAIELDPTNAAAWDTLAHVQAALGKRDEAIASYKKALELQSDLQESIDGLKQLETK